MSGPDSGGEAWQLQNTSGAALAAESARQDRDASGGEVCGATIWPSWADRWVPCPGHFRPDGTCTAYGSQHRKTIPAPAPAVPDNAGLRARVQRILGRRIGAPAIQLTADLFQPGEGPLAALLAERDEAVRQVAACICGGVK